MDLLAGAAFAWCTVYVVLACYFALLVGRSEDERLEYRLFALGCVSIAFYAFSNARHVHASFTPLAAANWGRLALLAPQLGAVALLHVVLLYAEVAPKTRRAVVAPGYALVPLFAVANWAGLLVDVHAVRVRVLGAGPFVYADATFAPRPLFYAFAAVLVVEVVLIVTVVVRAYFAGKREALFAAVGASALLVCALSDVLVALDAYRTLYLTEHGFCVFAFGLSHSLLARYVRVSDELERKGSELRRRARHLRRAYEELRSAQEELVRREQLAVVGELAAVISHEVRNPLAIISNAVASLKKPTTSDDDRATLFGILEEESARLNTMVGDLLRYARPLNVERRELDLHALMGRACDLTKGHPRVRLERPRVAELPLPGVYGDPSLLRQVFDNLVQNACQAMSDGGTLTVQILARDEAEVSGVAIELSDTGEGMDTQIRSRARTPFFTTRAEGTGLGLAISERIVTAHGGVMEIKSRKGEGTIVTVFLPAGRVTEVPLAVPGLARNPVDLERGDPDTLRPSSAKQGREPRARHLGADDLGRDPRSPREDRRNPLVADPDRD